jgi:DNA polymerase-3 subunit delta'
LGTWFRRAATPDLVRLERLTKDSGASSPARSRSIRCAGLQRLFATTPSLSPWRVVVIDAIDDLERPPPTRFSRTWKNRRPTACFLLVSHAPERLLPTIARVADSCVSRLCRRTPWRRRSPRGR